MSGKNIVHVVDNVCPRGGGLSKSVMDLTEILSSNLEITNSLLVGSTCDIVDNYDSAALNIFSFESEVGSRSFFTLLKERQWLKDKIKFRQPHLLHSHGIWSPVNHAAIKHAINLNIPFCIQPHGMLSPYPLSIKSTKKAIALASYQKYDLDMAKYIVATSDLEALDIRRFGLRQPIAVIPNGIRVSDHISLDNKSAYKKTHPVAEGDKAVLFLGRIHPIKGLSQFLRAWESVSPIGWRFLIAGPDECGHQAELEKEVELLGLGDIVSFIGPVGADEKQNLFQRAELLVLPSHSENFGLVIAEALSYEVPVITTEGTPWQSLAYERCGWYVGDDVVSLSLALEDVTTMPIKRLREMGKRGRRYVMKEFSFPGIISDLIETYEWALGSGRKPDCLYFD